MVGSYKGQRPPQPDPQCLLSYNSNDGFNMQTHSFHVNKSQVQFKWNKDVKPVLTVDSRAEVSFDLLDGGNNQITDKSTAEDVVNFKSDFADPIFGPIFVNGSEPGDVLKVEFLDLQCASYGWTAILKGFGIIAENFPDPYLKI
jgi:acetamidase/formamidase